MHEVISGASKIPEDVIESGMKKEKSVGKRAGNGGRPASDCNPIGHREGREEKREGGRG